MNYNLNVIEVSHDDDEFQQFMHDHQEEITHIFPHYTDEDAEIGEILMLQIGEVNAGVFIYQIKGEEMHVDVDFLVKKYRDQGVGKSFFVNHLNGSKLSGISKVIALTNNQVHIDYLKDIGFKKSDLFKERYELEVSEI